MVVLLRLFPVGWVLVPWCRVDVAGELDGVGGVSLPCGSGRVFVFASAGLRLQSSCFLAGAQAARVVFLWALSVRLGWFRAWVCWDGCVVLVVGVWSLGFVTFGLGSRCGRHFASRAALLVALLVAG